MRGRMKRMEDMFQALSSNPEKTYEWLDWVADEV